MLARKDGFFGLHFDLHPSKNDDMLGADVTEENIEELLTRVRPDFVQYDCKGHPGYTGCPVAIGWPSPGIVKDSLAIWRKVTRAHGVLLGIHYSGVLDMVAVEQRPDWARVDAEGALDKRATSTFGPYVDELMIPQLKEIVSKYDLDFVWVDGECWGAELDYSPLALSAWQQVKGQVPPPKNSSEQGWSEWKQFHREQFERYVIHWTEALKRYRPSLNVTSNWVYSTMSPIPVKAPVDHLSGDFDPNLAVDRARTEARYLASCGMPWDLLSWGFDRAKDLPESLKLPDQLKQEAGVVLMYGGAYTIYYCPTRSGHINDTIIGTAAEVAEFCRERQELCHRNTPIPQVALLYSSESHLDRSDRVFAWWDRPHDEVDGALHALLELHYSVDILSEYQLRPRLTEYPLVVLPDCHKLSADFIDSLLRYVEQGGNLLLMGQSCSRLFEPHLGVEFDGEPTEVNAALVAGRHNVAAPGRWQRVIPRDARVIAYRYHGDGSAARQFGIDIRDTGVSPEASKHMHREVAATIVDRGKGRICAVYGPVPMLFFNSHHPYLRRFIGDIVSQVFPEPLFETDAPPCVDMAARRSASGHMCIHILNLSNLPVSNRRPFADFVPSVGPITIRIRVEKRPLSVTFEPGNSELSWSYTQTDVGGVVEVEVPQVQIHGAVVIR